MSEEYTTWEEIPSHVTWVKVRPFYWDRESINYKPGKNLVWVNLDHVTTITEDLERVSIVIMNDVSNAIHGRLIK